jgi:hypothetical protein
VEKAKEDRMRYQKDLQKITLQDFNKENNQTVLNNSSAVRYGDG